MAELGGRGRGNRNTVATVYCTGEHVCRVNMDASWTENVDWSRHAGILRPIALFPSRYQRVRRTLYVAPSTPYPEPNGPRAMILIRTRLSTQVTSSTPILGKRHEISQCPVLIQTISHGSTPWTVRDPRVAGSRACYAGRGKCYPPFGRSSATNMSRDRCPAQS